MWNMQKTKIDVVCLLYRAMNRCGESNFWRWCIHDSVFGPYTCISVRRQRTQGVQQKMCRARIRMETTCKTGMLVVSHGIDFSHESTRGWSHNKCDHCRCAMDAQRSTLDFCGWMVLCFAPKFALSDARHGIGNMCACVLHTQGHDGACYANSSALLE